MSRTHADPARSGIKSSSLSGGRAIKTSPLRKAANGSMRPHAIGPLLRHFDGASLQRIESTANQSNLGRLVRHNASLEREADEKADRIHRLPNAAVIAEGPASALPPPKELDITRTGSTMTGGASELATGGEALAPNLRAFYEPQLGCNLASVRLHRGKSAQRRLEALGARAFTYGNHVWIGQNPVARPTPLLTHELAHVLQQESGALLRAEGARYGIQGKAIGEWWEENVSKNYRKGKEAAYSWLIDGLTAARRAQFNAVRTVARAALDEPALSVALKATGILEDVIEVATAAIYAVVGIVVGIGEGAVDIVKGLVGLVYTILDLCIRFLYGFIDRGAAFDERMREIVVGLSRLPQAMKALFDDWINHFKQASPERQSLMIGELTGQVIALIAGFEIAAAKAGQIPRLTMPVVVQAGDRLALAGVSVDVGMPVMTGVGVGTGVAVADAKANTMLMKGSGLPAGPTPFPRSSLRGVSLKWLRRNKPKAWREVPSDNGLGWKWIDENGVERLRYTRPSGESAARSKWSRQANGYFRWQNANAEFLDLDGNVVPANHPEFQELTHIAYEGIP